MQKAQKLRHTNAEAAAALARPGRYHDVADNLQVKEVRVAPGGGFRILSMGNEGWEVAKALNERGVAAFVLKYRLLPTEPDWATFDKGNPLTAPTPASAAAAAPARSPR